jgi:sugar-specific transcriptional regulator TrmB
MSSSDGAEEKILTQLGLTSLQAKVYLTLASIGQATLSDLSLNTKIDRANVYRVTNQLQGLQLIERMLMYPTQYKALPLNQGIRMLLDNKENEYLEVKAKSKVMLERFRQPERDFSEDDNCQFALIPDGKLIQRKFEQMINTNHKTHDILFYWQDFGLDYNEVLEIWTKLLVRGVRLRGIVYIEDGGKIPHEIVSLKKYSPDFELRRILTPPKATITIIDGKESFVSVTPKLHPSGHPSLWIQNPGILGVVQEYFDMCWRNSRKKVIVS